MSNARSAEARQRHHAATNEVKTVTLLDTPIIALTIDNQERLCLAQISNTLLKDFSYNEIHNRRVALGITCVQCTPVQLEILRRAGAMPVSSRRCGMITKREAERLCRSFLRDQSPIKLPEDFAFDVEHSCSWGCRGSFLPARYNSSRAKCIRCSFCHAFFSPNKFIFHYHRTPESTYVQPDAANFNSWRRHLRLTETTDDHTVSVWEEVKAMFNGGSRKRMLGEAGSPGRNSTDVVVVSTTPTMAPHTQLADGGLKPLYQHSISNPGCRPGLVPIRAVSTLKPRLPPTFPPTSGIYPSMEHVFNAAGHFMPSIYGNGGPFPSFPAFPPINPLRFGLIPVPPPGGMYTPDLFSNPTSKLMPLQHTTTPAHQDNRGEHDIHPEAGNGRGKASNQSISINSGSSSSGGSMSGDSPSKEQQGCQTRNSEENGSHSQASSDRGSSSGAEGSFNLSIKEKEDDNNLASESKQSGSESGYEMSTEEVTPTIMDNKQLLKLFAEERKARLRLEKKVKLLTGIARCCKHRCGTA